MAEPGVALSPGDPVAAALRGFGPIGILSVLVLLWARRSRTPWREIGYVRPESWIASLAVGIAFGGAFKLPMKAIHVRDTALAIIYWNLESEVAHLVFE